MLAELCPSAAGACAQPLFSISKGFLVFSRRWETWSHLEAKRMNAPELLFLFYDLRNIFQ